MLTRKALRAHRCYDAETRQSMICQRCGRSVTSSESFCSKCGARLAVGVLTPAPEGTDSRPDFAPAAHQAPTPRADDPTRVAGEGTGFGRPTSHQGTDPDLTRFADPDGTRFDADETRFAPPEDPAATRLAGPGPTGSFGADPDHGPLAVGQAFGNRYHIIRLLGVGVGAHPNPGVARRRGGVAP